MAIAKAPAGESTQRRTAAERGKHEKRNDLTLVNERRFNAAAERDHPRIAHHRNVLDDVVIHALETELVIRVGEMMAGDREIPAASRVTRSGAPIERDSRVRMQIGWTCAEPGERIG